MSGLLDLGLRRGMGGHQLPSMQTDEWLTPPEIIDALAPFCMDPCACDEPRPWPTAAVHITREENGLRRAWAGRVWLNPPYGGPAIVGPWMQRMAAHRNGIALIFARTETAIFHRTVWNIADAALFLLGRLFFYRRDGTRATNNAGAPSVLVAYGAENAASLAVCGIPGKLVRLRP